VTHAIRVPASKREALSSNPSAAKKKKKRKSGKLGVVVHVYNPSSLETEAGKSQFVAWVDYAVRPCLKSNNKTKHPGFKRNEDIALDRWLSKKLSEKVRFELIDKKELAT
jgi:hypothetical protein